MNDLDTLLDMYAEKGLRIFPAYGLKETGKKPVCLCGNPECNHQGKHPSMKSWQYAASDDVTRLKKWAKRLPFTNWGVVTGEKSGVIVVDVDPRHGGHESWENLLADHSDDTLETWTVETGGGGAHYYFQHPGYKVGNRSIGLGLDIRGDGGLAIVPPSIHSSGDSYLWNLSPYDVDLAELPPWIDLKSREERVDTPEEFLEYAGEEVPRAIMYLNSLNDERRDSYDDWLAIGMALTTLGDKGLKLWDHWSKKSPKYQLGECSRKWRTFTADGGLTLESLKYMAEEDNPESMFTIPFAPKSAKPSDVSMAIATAGWEFRENVANNDIEFNGAPLTDNLMEVLYYALLNRGYRSRVDIRTAWTNIGVNHSFHPVLEYLDRKSWNKKDNIKKLAKFFKDKDKIFALWLRRWLIGAVARVAAYPQGQQNRMLVLDGRQNLGKSFFVRWLADEVPHLHMEGQINVNDKDDSIRLMSMWIWEVSELGATLRRSDREQLKAFISRENIRVRKPYGHTDVDRPAMASFIGTINNVGGFLSDPSGNRRFMTCTLTAIDWSYTEKVDIGQVWAQAYHLFKEGEPWNLEGEEYDQAEGINTRYTTQNPLLDYIERYFTIQPEQTEWFTPTVDILDTLKISGGISTSDMRSMKQVAEILSPLGCEDIRRRVNGRLMRGWTGITASSSSAHKAMLAIKQLEEPNESPK